MRMRYSSLVIALFTTVAIQHTAIKAAPLTVVAATSDLAAITDAVVQNTDTRIMTLVKGPVNMHAINPRPSMVMHVRKADVLIRIGMQQDSWLDGVIQVARNRNVMPQQPGYLDASDAIEPLDVPTHSIDGSMGDVHLQGNPHYLLDPRNGARVAAAIANRLVVLDPSQAAVYHANAAQFKRDINQRYTEWLAFRQRAQVGVFVTYHSTWRYLLHAFDLKSLGELEPLPGIPPTTRHLAAMYTKAQAQTQPVTIVTARYYPARAGETYSRRIGGKAHVLSPTVAEPTKAGYLALFDTLLGTLLP